MGDINHSRIQKLPKDLLTTAKAFLNYSDGPVTAQ